MKTPLGDCYFPQKAPPIAVHREILSLANDPNQTLSNRLLTNAIVLITALTNG